MKVQVHYADEVARNKRRMTMKTNGGHKGKTKPSPTKGELKACPFCRELFVEGEATCPECGIQVRDLASLPPSLEAQSLEEAAESPTVPQAEPLPWNDLSRGRGVLLACALVGLAAFYLPWAVQTMPESVTYTAAELGRKQNFFWSTFTAWLVLFPAAATRRTLLKMHGARVALTLLSAMPGIWCLFLLSRPTKLVVKGLPFEYHWGPGFFITLVASIVATAFAVRFGGRLDDVKVPKGSSAGEVLH